MTNNSINKQGEFHSTNKAQVDPAILNMYNRLWAPATISVDTVKLSLLFFVQRINYIKRKVLRIVNNVQRRNLQDRLPYRNKQSCISSSLNDTIKTSYPDT